jgi:hypothetical protein
VTAGWGLKTVKLLILELFDLSSIFSEAKTSARTVTVDSDKDQKAKLPNSRTDKL